MLRTWRITVRVYSATEPPHEFWFLVATEHNRSTDALQLARFHYPAKWWETATIIDVTYVGELFEAEGLELPRRH